MLRLLLALLAAAFVTLAGACPTDLPEGCACNDLEGLLSISCASAPLASVLPKLANRTVSSLRLANCSVPALERQLALKGLRTLELAHCGISTVDPKALDMVAPSLEELSLPDNRLTEVPRLQAMPSLKKITLNRNLISELPPGVFSFAPSLAELRLEENRVCSLQFNSLNETKPTLALLDLSGNCISSLANVGSLRFSPALAYLDLSSNKLTELAPLSLMNLPSLVEVRLSDNLLARLLPLSISATPELRFVYLQNNLLDSLAFLPQLKKLEILDVRTNRLTKVPLLTDSPMLRQLRLDANRITAIEPRVLASNPKLQLLSVQDNSISSLGASSFEGLSQLVVLLLSNNGLTSLDRASLNPLKALQQLNLHNNSISTLDENSFAPLKQLTTLDISKNQLDKLPKGIFESLPKLFWVDLSGNKLFSFEKATFTKRISNLLIGENPLNCDEVLDWFVQWLVVNRVRTSLPNQPEVVCSAPQAYEGVKLQSLMIKKANETMKVIGLQSEKPKAGQALVSNLLPGMSLMNGMMSAAGQQVAGLGQAPALDALLNGIPSLRNLPLGAAPAGGGVPAAGSVRSMNSAIEQFAAPFVRFATGGQPQAADLEQLMQSIPKMIAAAPGGVDISQLPPDLIVHVLRGGQIPGISRDTLDRIVTNHMKNMAEVAAEIERGGKPADVEKYLPPLDRLPPELITSVMSGQTLPALSAEQMESIKQYYISSLTLSSSSSATDGSSSNASETAGSSVPAAPALPAFPLTPQTLAMMRLLPAGYNISRIPVEIMNAISNGEMPDLKLLPADLQEHLKTNTDKMFNMFQGAESASTQNLREVLEKLPSWDRPVKSATYSPYDLNDVKRDADADRKAAAQASTHRLMVAGVIGLLALVSLIVIVAMCVAQHRKIARGKLETSDGSSIDTMRADASSTPISQPSFHSSLQRGIGIVHRRSPPQNI